MPKQVGSPHTRLRKLIESGVAPEEATDTLLEELPQSWRGWVRGFVLKQARDEEGRVVNRIMKKELGSALVSDSLASAERITKGGKKFRKVQEDIQNTVYRTAKGVRVLWDDMTVDLLDLKIAQLRKQVGALVDHLLPLEAARCLCVERGVERLGDIPGWPSLVRAAVRSRDASGLVEAA